MRSFVLAKLLRKAAPAHTTVAWHQAVGTGNLAVSSFQVVSSAGNLRAGSPSRKEMCRCGLSQGNSTDLLPERAAGFCMPAKDRRSCDSQFPRAHCHPISCSAMYCRAIAESAPAFMYCRDLAAACRAQPNQDATFVHAGCKSTLYTTFVEGHCGCAQQVEPAEPAPCRAKATLPH